MGDQPGRLRGKNAVVTGIATEHSIADTIAEAFHAEGTNLFLSFASQKLWEKNRALRDRIATASNICDVSNPKDIENLGLDLSDIGRKVDVFVHSIAFANRDAIGGNLTAVSRDDMLSCLQISATSLVEIIGMLKQQDLLAPGCCVLAMTYIGGERVIPQYGVMSHAKALLDSLTRSLAYELGSDPNLRGRANLISAGPLRTAAAMGIPGFRDMHRQYQNHVPLERNIDVEDVAQAAVFLASDAARNITGQTLYVDAGFHMMGMMPPKAADPSS